MPLLDQRGNPIDSVMFAKKKKEVSIPKVGDSFGQWAGQDNRFADLPGGGVIQFDLSKLTLADYRSMRQHYQIGSSLNVLAFIMHQIDWRIEGGTAKIRDFVTDQFEQNWTQIIRSISQSFWAGFGPGAVNYKNGEKYVELDSIKDLIPEECRVNWKKHEGWAPEGKAKPKIYNYDGLIQNGNIIPPENTLWYPLLMENGDYYGRKLLKPAFPAWYFSNLIHLFANRYFERFGEPLPIGRGRLDDDVAVGDGEYVSGRKVMQDIVSGIRSRSTVVLPSDRDPITKEFDFDISYLESQMRGADFERYLSRLDEEMSLSVFTPILLFRTADVGSYNLGQAHLRIFQQMLNAIAGDIQYYLQHYLVDRLVALNFKRAAGDVKWVYRKQGQGDIGTYKELMVELVRQGQAMPDLQELGAITGLTFEEVEQITEPIPEPENPDPNGDGLKNEPATKPKLKIARSVLGDAVERAVRQVGNGQPEVQFGYKNKFRAALEDDGHTDAEARRLTNEFYSSMDTWLPHAIKESESADDVKNMLHSFVDSKMNDYER